MDKRRKDPQTHAVIGAAMEVHRQLGSGLLERVYQQALEIECGMRGIPASTEVPLTVWYKNRPLAARYRADLICFGKIIIECKAVKTIGPEHIAQVLHYLKITQMPLALVINFNLPSLKFQRVVLSHGPQAPPIALPDPPSGSSSNSLQAPTPSQKLRASRSLK